jgi:hypothetical protein
MHLPHQTSTPQITQSKFLNVPTETEPEPEIHQNSPIITEPEQQIPS